MDKIKGTFGTFRVLILAAGLAVSCGCTFLVRTAPFDAPAAPAPPYRGIVHVHSEFSHDSHASLERILGAAQKARLDFVVVTDHNNRDGVSAYEAMNAPERPLLAFGTEMTTRDGHVLAFGIDEMPPKNLEPAGLFEWIRAHGGYGFLAHPLSVRNGWRRPEIKNFSGLEIYNFGHTLYPANKFTLALKTIFLFPGAFLRAYQEVPSEPFLYWDELTKTEKYAGIGGADAHIHLQWFGFAPENLQLMFQAVTNYVYADELEPRALFDAMGRGRSFLAWERLGPAEKFSFSASQGTQTAGPGQGLAGGAAEFKIAAPKRARLRLVRGGVTVHEAEAERTSFSATEPGAYRAEVYQDKDLWIASNPIYLEP